MFAGDSCGADWGEKAVREMKSSLMVERSSLVEKICGALAEYISESGLSAGAKLESESRLAERFGVSRLALREALVRVKALGLIEARHGSGWYVRQFKPADSFRQLSPLLRHFTGADLEQIMEVRMVIEPMVASKAAGGISEEGLGRLGESVSGMVEAVEDRRRFIEHDMAYHSILAEECGNKILTILCAMLTDLSRQAQWAYRDSVEDRMRSVAYHRALLEKIESRDAEGARRTMEEHIRDVGTRLVEEKES
ncbi:MAG: FadR family transcriptional regulator [Phycisphaerae bacterium]|nr:FadR family transcriptional regulator [Phycisphaerae bacterium]